MRAHEARQVEHVGGRALIQPRVQPLVRARARARVRVGVGVRVGVRVRVGARLDEASHVRRSARERLVVRVVLGVHVELDAGPRPEGDRRDLRYRVGGWGHIYSSVVMARVRVRDRG